MFHFSPGEVYLRSGSPKAYGLDGWTLTLDGRSVAKGASDNLSRAFDLGGGPLWIDGCTFNNTGSEPGNDGEGVLCQRHGGTDIFSWAITNNRHDLGDGEPGYMGGWAVHCYGLLIAWNKTPGWVGNALAGDQFDASYVENQAKDIKVAKIKQFKGKNVPTEPAVVDVLQEPPSGEPPAPHDVRAKRLPGGEVEIAWGDAAENEIGFRVDRQIGSGVWTTIAMRPRYSKGHERNPQAWIDFLAPPGRELGYRVVALAANGKGGASKDARLPPSNPMSGSRGTNAK